MADNRKYYYLKLKESYFDEDAIVLLESMQDGIRPPFPLPAGIRFQIYSRRQS